MPHCCSREAAKTRYKQIIFVCLVANAFLVASFIFLLRDQHSSFKKDDRLNSAGELLPRVKFIHNTEKNLQFNGKSYFYSPDKVNFATAVRRCRSKGMQIVTITNKKENKFLSENVNIYTWIGLKKVQRSWKWLSNCFSSFTNWDSDEPNNVGGNENCVHFWRLTPEKWNDIECNFKGSYVCEKKCAPENSIISNDVVAPRYYISKERKTYADAEIFCENLNMSLATINNKHENDYLSGQILLFTRGNGPFIGLNDRRREGSFEWTSGCPLSYKNFAKNEPSNGNGIEHCVQFYDKSYQWNDVNCEQKFQFICERSTSCKTIAKSKLDIKAEVWLLGWFGMLIAFGGLLFTVCYTICKRKKRVPVAEPAPTTVPAAAPTPAPTLPSAPPALSAPLLGASGPGASTVNSDAPPTYSESIAMHKV